MSRKTITVSEGVYNLVDDTKLDEDSFNDCLERLARLHQLVDGVREADESVLECAERIATTEDDAPGAEVLTEDHLDDIGAELDRRLERFLDDRQMRR